MKHLDEIKGCSDENDSVSNLNFICENVFQMRPHYSYEEETRKNGSSLQFIASVHLNSTYLCSAVGKNKKVAKMQCAKKAFK